MFKKSLEFRISTGFITDLEPANALWLSGLQGRGYINWPSTQGEHREHRWKLRDRPNQQRWGDHNERDSCDFGNSPDAIACILPLLIAEPQDDWRS